MARCPESEVGGHHDYVTADDGVDYCMGCGISFLEASRGYGVGGDLPGKNGAYHWKRDGQTSRGRKAAEDGREKQGQKREANEKLKAHRQRVAKP